MRPFRSFLLVFILLFLTLSACHTSRKTSSSESAKTETDPHSIQLLQKYAGILGVDVLELSNTQLYTFIDSWMGTPYKYGGKTKNGIDCSAFTETLYKNVFGKDISGSSRDLYEKCEPVLKDNLREGDLVFFKIDSDKISHVGVYLTHHKFVHATVSKGVMISDLNEAYYLKYYFHGGRLR